MRHLRRKGRPALLDSGEVDAVRQQLSRFHLAGGTRQTQLTLDFEAVFAPLREAVRVSQQDVLAPTFGRHCAYTEQVVTSPELVLHRPPRDAIGLRDDVALDHYYWLATEWSNWYQAASDVARRKGATFPVHGRRSPVPEPGRDTRPRRDLGLLLEPCHDHPQWWLRANPDGTWAQASHPADAERYAGSPNRGALTIEVLGLNEPWLVEQRRAAVQRPPNVLLAPPGTSEPPRDLLGDGPFLGFRRQVAAQELLHTARVTGAADPDELLELAPELVPLLLEDRGPMPPSILPLGPELLAVAKWIKAGADGLTRLAAILSDDRAPGPRAARAPTPTPTATPPPTSSPATIRPDAYIATIEIRNFRCLDHIVIDLSGDTVTAGRQIVLDPTHQPAPEPAVKVPLAPRSTTSTTSGRPDSQVVPSAVFLGENGSGKSTVLQAIAVALAGAELGAIMGRAGLTWTDLLRRGAERGEVAVTFGRGERIRLTFDRAGHAFEGGPPNVDLLVRAFGASRALAASRTAGERATVEVSNLFIPTDPVIDVDGWLAGLDPGSFNIAAATIRDFLDLPPEGRLELVEGRLTVSGTPLRLLSDGYKSVITLLCGVMAGSGLATTDTSSLRGVVLIDEIGAHLHPRWRMHITRRLRAAFPQLQLLLSTHEPLCLRGMRAHEAVRISRPDPDAPAELEVVDRSPSDYRVDQLLTSEFFGLGTTIDPEEQQRWDAYYAALTALERARQRTPPVPELATLAADVERLRGLAPTHGVLGVTRRDQLAYEVIDRHLAREGTLTPAQRRADRARAIAEAADLYQLNIPRGRDGAR